MSLPEILEKYAEEKLRQYVIEELKKKCRRVYELDGELICEECFEMGMSYRLPRGRSKIGEACIRLYEKPEICDTYVNFRCRMVKTVKNGKIEISIICEEA